MIIIERPHQRPAKVWTANSKADFCRKVSESMDKTSADYRRYDRLNQIVECWGDDRDEWPVSLQLWERNGGGYPMAYMCNSAGVAECEHAGLTAEEQAAHEFEFWRYQLADDLSMLDVIETAEEYMQYAPTGHNTPAPSDVSDAARWLDWI